MPYLTLDKAALAFGDVPILDQVDFQLDEGERVGLIGRNGGGKSSMLRVLAEQAMLDDGVVWRAPGLRIFYVAQEPVLNVNATVFDEIVRELGELRQLLTDYHHLTRKLAKPDADFDTLLGTMQPLQIQLETGNGWAAQERIETALELLDLDADSRIGDLPGGVHKRVALAQVLVAEPDVLILDEPTNHLGFSSIEWLENLLKNFRGSVLLVTHDRHFLDNVATRIVELDRGNLASFPGNFSAYLHAKEKELKDVAALDAKFDNGLAQEELWIRQHIRARHARNEGRARQLEQLRSERTTRRVSANRLGKSHDADARSGKLVAELTDVSKKFGAQKVIDNFSCRIQRGDKIGLLGQNGAGRNVLLKIILGELAPDSGEVKMDANTSVAYFDQLRTQLDEEATLVETVSQDVNYIEVGGIKKDIVSYLGDFLFSPERARSQVKNLSGGERNRLSLARLFSRPASVLVLNEPTNDLDIETLELLEDMLAKYDGTLFLVSHDRTFLDNVVTHMIAFEGDGKLVEYIGGYEDWAQVKQPATVQKAASATPRSGVADAVQAKPASRPTAVKTVDDREHIRYPVRWRAAVVHKNVERNDIFHGHICDLSVSGASVFLHHNIFRPEVVMLLAVPPLHAGQKETIIEIHCHMVYTVLDSDQSLFRIGLRFMSFKGNGESVLTKTLSKRAIPG